MLDSLFVGGATLGLVSFSTRNRDGGSFILLLFGLSVVFPALALALTRVFFLLTFANNNNGFVILVPNILSVKNVLLD